MKGDRYHNDEAILQGVKDGDENALRVLVDRYRSLMLVEAVGILRDKQDAEDAVQNVFLRFWIYRERIEYKNSLGPYLLKAARNECLVKIAKEKVLTRRQERFNYFNATYFHIDPLENKELGQLIDQAIETMPSAAQRSFKMLYLESKTLKNIASEERISIQTVKNNISRGLKFLRKKLHSLK